MLMKTMQHQPCKIHCILDFACVVLSHAKTFCASSGLFCWISWCKSVKPNLLVCHYDFTPNSKPNRYGKKH